MRIKEMGWLTFIAISIMTNINGQSFASESLFNADDFETELSLPSRKYRKTLTGRVSADNQEKQAAIEDKIQSVNDTISLKTPCNKATNSDETDYDKCENAIAQLFYPVILDQGLMLQKLKKISMHLFYPLILYVDENEAIKFKTIKLQFQNLIHKLKDKEQFQAFMYSQTSDKQQNMDWKEFIHKFNITIRPITDYLDDPEIQEKITNPPYADKLKTFLNLDIHTIFLSNFCHRIIEFDYMMRKAFLTKPSVDGEPSCEKCGEQTIGMTMCYSQPVLECHFCGHESCIERIF